MTIPPAPSAWPPSSRRFAALDSPQAMASVAQADSGAGAKSVAQPEAPPFALAAASTAATPRPKPAAVPVVDPASARPVRKERLQPVTLRVPEALHAELLYIAENSPRSMNRFIVDTLGPAVATEVEKIQKRKALGLD